MRSVLRPALRVEALTDRHRAELTRLVDADPVVNAVVAARLRAFGSIEPRHFGGTVLGVRDGVGRLAGAAFSGGNLVPLGGGRDEWRALAEHICDRRRVCTSIIGKAEAVATLWEVLAPAWGPPRAVRSVQPLLALDRGAPLPPGDPRLRPIRLDQLDRYLPAAAAMFEEELGVSPYRAAGAGQYRRRVAAVIADRRAFGVLAGDGDVLFKADLGAISAHTCQVQGVWVRPDQRGRGLGTAALAGVLRHALTLAPTVSLYVNDFNVAARRMYARLGMREIGALSTVLF